MNWKIPAKTFLIGEYAALQGESAIVLTTTPTFSVSLKKNTKDCFHPESPAGKFWLNFQYSLQDLTWQDPYQSLGGLGASSAQFIGAYWVADYLSKKKYDKDELLNAYYDFAWQGQGMRPSGYDILAQVEEKCVYINKNNQTIECFDWVFQDVSFVLVRTGNKIATHYHLQTSFFSNLSSLSEIVEQATQAFINKDSTQLVQAINLYQQQLTTLNLSSGSTLEKINVLQKNPNLLAIKGCGALGADVLLLIFPSDFLSAEIKKLAAAGWIILASEKNLYKKDNSL